jgi:hemolysin III
MFGVIWGIAIIGVVLKSLFADRFMVVNTFGYLIMGWLIVFAWGPLSDNMYPTAITMMIAGGLSYSIGTIFFGWHRIPILRKIKLPFAHAIWHLFVLGGSVCMFFSVLLFV